MDGVGVLESMSKAEYEEPKKSFTFLADIPESLSFLVSCIVDVRQFISDIPEFYSIQEDEETANRVEATTESVIKSVRSRGRSYLRVALQLCRSLKVVQR